MNEDKMLTEEEFNIFREFFVYACEKPEYEELVKFDDYDKSIKFFSQTLLEFLKIYYPKVEMRMLEYRENIKEPNDNLTWAFKFEKDRPELYMLMQPYPVLIDEYRFDAYEQGPFKKPNWSF